MKAIAACVALALLAITQVHAQQTLGEVIDKGGQKLSKDDLAALLPGTKHTGKTDTLGTRTWTHEADGKLVASSIGAQVSRGVPFRGNGTWSVVDSGKYCFDINWPRSNEKRCLIVYKLADSYFGVIDDADKGSNQMLRFTLEK